jgi:alpha-beta hydrolase superfamily lysophospholipase
MTRSTTKTTKRADSKGKKTAQCRTPAKPTVDGLAMHYLAAGGGEPLVLIHGYAETSDTWRAVIPALARRWRVIAPDLPGIGESAIPDDGLDMATAAARLIRSRNRSASGELASSATTSE